MSFQQKFEDSLKEASGHEDCATRPILDEATKLPLVDIEMDDVSAETLKNKENYKDAGGKQLDPAKKDKNETRKAFQNIANVPQGAYKVNENIKAAKNLKKSEKLGASKKPKDHKIDVKPSLPLACSSTLALQAKNEQKPSQDMGKAAYQKEIVNLPETLKKISLHSKKLNDFEIFEDASSGTDKVSISKVALFEKEIPQNHLQIEQEKVFESPEDIIPKSPLLKSLNRQLQIQENFKRYIEVSAYQDDCLKDMKKSEKKNRPRANYMTKQLEINASHRAIVVDWLVEVIGHYGYNTETLYLAVSYMDRFLSQFTVEKSKLQLVGIACFWVAAKYEEVNPPELNDLILITDEAYTRSQMFCMDKFILRSLSFSLGTPTIYAFLKIFRVLCDLPDKESTLAKYLCELSLLENLPYLKFLPSMIAAGSIALANHMLGGPIWSKNLKKFTDYNLKDLKDVILSLNNSHKAAASSDLPSIHSKFSGLEFFKVAAIKPINLTESLFDEIVEDLETNQNDLEKNLKRMKVLNNDSDAASESSSVH